MNITEVLREHGYKVTPQRLAVYEVIDQNKTHPNAEAIYKELQPRYPSMSLAQCIRQWKFLQKLELSKSCNVKKNHIATILMFRLMPISGVRFATALMMWMSIWKN